jgi:hypothetical protein
MHCLVHVDRLLTRALLHSQLGLHWWVPDGHLIPPVTNRANYIHWLHDLLSLCPGDAKSNIRSCTGLQAYNTIVPGNDLEDTWWMRRHICGSVLYNGIQKPGTKISEGQSRGLTLEAPLNGISPVLMVRV